MINGPVRWFCDEADAAAPFLRALAEVRDIGVPEGWCYHHVQAVILANDIYAATGNPQYFWNKPHTVPGGKHCPATPPGVAEMTTCRDP
jgi:hypothetical protein